MSGLPTLGKMSLSKELHFNTSIANLVILRGKGVHSADLGEHLAHIHGTHDKKEKKVPEFIFRERKMITVCFSSKM